MSWIDIGALEDVKLRGARIVKSPVGCIALFRTGEEEVFATGNTCPHKQGPLSEGIVHDRKVTCPLHNWVFSLETGEALGEDGSIPVYPVMVQNGRIMLDSTAIAKRSGA